MIMLLHSSKTMRAEHTATVPYRKPQFLSEAVSLMEYLKTLEEQKLCEIMNIKPELARKTLVLIGNWTASPEFQIPAIDAFLGDIYSGLQASSLNAQDREFANKHLVILSGLYGILRPLDCIMPYRLEMAYRLTDFKTPSLYDFWGDKIAKVLPKDDAILNLSSVEYSKVVTKFLTSSKVVTPRFLTINVTTKEPTFVVVHAKIARGAFAHWTIKNRITDISDIIAFNELGYSYDDAMSTASEPVFVCDEFKGLGLSVRLS